MFIMDFNYEINEIREDNKMVLVTNDILEKLKNEYIESETKLDKFKNIIPHNEYKELEFKYYNNDLNINDKKAFLNYKNNLEKLQLETNIKESYYVIMEAFQRKQIEYSTFVSERDDKLNFICLTLFLIFLLAFLLYLVLLNRSNFHLIYL